MKLRYNFITISIATAISILISYGFFSYSYRDVSYSLAHIIVTIVSFVFSAITLIGVLGIDLETERITFIMRATSFGFFIIGVVSLIILSYFKTNFPAIIIVSGVLLLVHALVSYAIIGSRQ